MTREVCFIGGVNLPSAEDVYRLAASKLGDRLKRVPDGETGPARRQWIQCQRPFFLQHPLLENVEEDPDRPGEFRQPRVGSRGIYGRTEAEVYPGRARLRPGAKSEDLYFDNIGYADWAIESYDLLQRLKDRGEVPQSWRMQVSMPAPKIPLTGRMVFPDQVPLIEPAYRDAYRREIERMVAAIPADDLSIQWDCTSPLEIEKAADAAARQEILDYIGGLAKYVPEGVELGYHLCYGDFEHRHAWDPKDLGTCVMMANHLAATVGRSLDWVHMPVPRGRSDVAYFEPLRDLRTAAETTLVLGLVHHTDGVDGTAKRLRSAVSIRGEFAIACECGMGRRPRETMGALFDIHAKAADLEI